MHYAFSPCVQLCLKATVIIHTINSPSAGNHFFADKICVTFLMSTSTYTWADHVKAPNRWIEERDNDCVVFEINF